MSVGYDVITGKILKKLFRKSIITLINLFNVPLRLKCVQRYWKVAELITITEPGKQINEVTSCRLISLATKTYITVKIVLKLLKSLLEENCTITLHQFRFINNHSTIGQVHRITNVTELTERKK